MKTVIIDKKQKQLVTVYDGAPNQTKFGGDWSNPELFLHLELSSELISGASMYGFVSITKLKLNNNLTVSLKDN